MTIAVMVVAQAVEAGPFPTTDQNPLAVSAGLPSPWPAAIGDKHSAIAALTFDWSNTAAIQQSSREDLVVDAESREWRVDFQHTIADKLALRMRVPYRSVTPGSLDGFIDDWHATFGQPEGDRPQLGKNQLHVAYRRDGVYRFDIEDESAGLGDIHLDLGYQLAINDTQAVSAWLGVKLPTSDTTALTPNTVSANAGLSIERTLSSRWRAFGQASATLVERGGPLADLQNAWVAQGMLGIDYLFSQVLALTIQVDAHSALYRDSSLDLMGSAWILTVGGDFRFANDWHMQFGVGEDIKVEASPDVNFVLTIAKTWR